VAVEATRFYSLVLLKTSCKKAADAIHKEGFVLLLGEPSSGKSVIAATLAMTSADSNNSLVVRIAKASEFKDHWSPDESENQFFWIDGAFGAIVHDESLTDMWAKTMPEVMATIKKGARVVMTSRD
jgi:energy-coupling factor transporter ATP-binding protein EcfA2